MLEKVDSGHAIRGAVKATFHSEAGLIASASLQEYNDIRFASKTVLPIPLKQFSNMVGCRRRGHFRRHLIDGLQASESRLYSFSPETKEKLRKFRLSTSRAKDPQAVIC